MLKVQLAEMFQKFSGIIRCFQGPSELYQNISDGLQSSSKSFKSLQNFWKISDSKFRKYVITLPTLKFYLILIFIIRIASKLAIEQHEVTTKLPPMSARLPKP